MPEAGRFDQAASLRRLFARPSLRVLPILVPAQRCPHRTAWLARLARAFAAAGERTLVLDGSRAQLAAAFGLKARYDLMHAQQGECALHAVRLEVEPGLAVVPTVRAFDLAAQQKAALATLLSDAPRLVADIDLLIVLLSSAQATLLAHAEDGTGPEFLVPTAPTARDVAAALDDLRKTTERAEIVGFRWLFLGMDEAAAATLARRLAASAKAWTEAQLRYGGAVRTARDLARVVRAAAGWDLARIELPEEEGMF